MPWDEARRFEIRCELDAAFFHLYLPCELDGGWRRAKGETPEQLAALKHHFLQKMVEEYNQVLQE